MVMDQKDDSFYSPPDTGQVDRLLATIEFSKALVSAYDMETLLTAILERIKAIIPAQNWSLLLIDPQTGELYFAVIVGLAPETVKDIRLKPGEGIAGTVAQTGKPIFIPDVRPGPPLCRPGGCPNGLRDPLHHRPAPDRPGSSDRGV